MIGVSSGESPIVDTKEVGTKQTFTNELLQSIPSARDPWVILQQTAGIAMDRENVGGNMSGQQSNYVSRGGNPTNNKWSLDGIDITDMAATGGSPPYFDFDMFEEMTINTGGVDVTQQTGGVGINLVTKSGTDRFKGSSRFYVTDKNLESQNITDAQRNQGAFSGRGFCPVLFLAPFSPRHQRMNSPSTCRDALIFTRLHRRRPEPRPRSGGRGAPDRARRISLARLRPLRRAARLHRRRGVPPPLGRGA